MKTSFATIAVLLSAFLQGASTKPIDVKDLSKRQGIPGQVVMCSRESQCSAVQTPWDGTSLCIDFSGNLTYLNHDLATVTIDDLTCTVFSDATCTGTKLWNDVALGSTHVNDLTKLSSGDISGSASSIRCAFL